MPPAYAGGILLALAVVGCPGADGHRRIGGSTSAPRADFAAAAEINHDSGAAAEQMGGWSHPNEPDGFVPIVRRSFGNPRPERGWEDLTSTYLKIGWRSAELASDSGRPVARMLFPRGWRGGIAPAHAEYTIPRGRRAREIYIAYDFKVSENWYGHPVVSKIGYAWIGGKPMFYSGLIGKGMAPLRLQARVQGVVQHPSQGEDLRLIPGRGVVSRGEWHHAEYLLVANAGRLANGVVRWWLDGELVGQAKDVGWVGPDDSDRWEIVSWRPIWGGAGGVLPVDQYMYLRNFYASVPRRSD